MHRTRDRREYCSLRNSRPELGGQGPAFFHIYLPTSCFGGRSLSSYRYSRASTHAARFLRKRAAAESAASRTRPPPRIMASASEKKPVIATCSLTYSYPRAARLPARSRRASASLAPYSAACKPRVATCSARITRACTDRSLTAPIYPLPPPRAREGEEEEPQPPACGRGIQRRQLRGRPLARHHGGAAAVPW